MLGVTHYSPSAFDELERALRTRRLRHASSCRSTRASATCEQTLLPLAAELGVAVIVMRPFGDGALARPVSPRRRS